MNHHHNTPLSDTTKIDSLVYDKEKVISQMRGSVLLIASVIALAPFAIDAYLPAIPQIAQTFGITAPHAEISVSIFLISFAIGQLVGGPLADRRGRRTISLLGIAGFGIASWLIVFIQSFELFLSLRSLQGFFGGFAIVACFSATRDAFSGKELGKFVSLITSVMLITPILSPFIGSAMLLVANWRWIFALMTGYALLVFFWSWRKFGETLNPAYKPGSVWGSYKRILLHKQSLLLLTISGLSMAVMFTFLASSSSTYQQFFGVSAQVYALLFATNVTMVLVLTNLNVFLLKYYSIYRIMGTGIGLQLCASIGLFLLSQTLAPLWLFVALVMVAIGCMGIVLPNTISELMTLHPQDAGTCNALGGLIRFSLGGVLSAAPIVFVSEGFTAMAATMSALAAMGLIFWWPLAIKISPRAAS